MPQVLREAGGRLRAGESREAAAGERSDRHDEQYRARPDDEAHFDAVLYVVDEPRRDEGDNAFDYRFEHDENERQYRRALVFADAFGEFSEHLSVLSVFCKRITSFLHILYYRYIIF